MGTTMLCDPCGTVMLSDPQGHRVGYFEAGSSRGVVQGIAG